MLLFLVVIIAFAYIAHSMAKPGGSSGAIFFALIGITCVSFLLGGILGLPIACILCSIAYLFRNSDAYKKNSKGYVPKEGEVSRTLVENIIRLLLGWGLGILIIVIIVLYFYSGRSYY